MLVYSQLLNRLPLRINTIFLILILEASFLYVPAGKYLRSKNYLSREVFAVWCIYKLSMILQRLNIDPNPHICKTDSLNVCAHAWHVLESCSAVLMHVTWWFCKCLSPSVDFGRVKRKCVGKCFVSFHYGNCPYGYICLSQWLWITLTMCKCWNIDV